MATPAPKVKTPRPKKEKKARQETEAEFALAHGMGPAMGFVERAPLGNRPVKKPRHYEDSTNIPEAMKKCLDLVSTLLSQRYARFFAEPVDPVALNIPDYFKSNFMR